MDHKWLEDLVSLVRERSFSRAAESRHVTQPQFSRRIRALEMWAGIELVDRAVVPLRLTAAGEELLPVARRALAELNEVRARLGKGNTGPEWVVLGTARTLSRTTVPGWLNRVQRSVGEFRLRIMTISVHEGASALEQGGIDFLLSFNHPGLPITMDEKLYEGLSLGSDELVAVSAPGADGKPLHALPGTHGNPVTMLSYAPSLALNQILRNGLSHRQGEVHMRTVTESDFAESLQEQVMQGAGMAWLPRALVAADLRDRRLVLADNSEGIRFGIRLYRSRSPRNELVQRVWAASTAS